MRFRIRRSHAIHPLAYREGRNGALAHGDEEEWNIRRATPNGEAPPAENLPEAEMTAPVPPPAAPLPNGFRAQATSGDARAERLVRAVRMEVADLRQAIGSYSEARDEMLELDLEAVRSNPEAAATLPPSALARALAAAADRIAELEASARDHEHRESTLRDDLAQLHEDHSYTRGRMEMLQEVIAALHANLEDLRYERHRQAPIEAPPAQRAIRPGERPNDPFGMGGAFK
ncbi:MAG: hypothetical protein WD557_08460 [Dehalococcoidia bacterium]